MMGKVSKDIEILDEHQYGRQGRKRGSMRIVIDINDEDYKRIQDLPDVFNSLTSRAYSAIRNGTPLPDGAEILTKEAYSDLCTRAADVPDTNVGKLDGNPIDIDKVVEHYEGTLESLKGIDLEVDG